MNKRFVEAIKSKSKSSLAFLLALIVLGTALVGGAVAFITASTKPVVNKFIPAVVTCQIVESVSEEQKSSVQIRNTGDIDAYIRVAVVGNTLDEDGNVTGELDVSPYLAGTGWEKSGDYYYYTSPVAPDGLTGELLTAAIPLGGANRVTILAEAIQADGNATVAAWGWSA